MFVGIKLGGDPRVVVSTAAFHDRGLRQPGREFRIMCLEDSVISINSPSSGGSPGPVQPINVHKGGLKPDSFHLGI